MFEPCDMEELFVSCLDALHSSSSSAAGLFLGRRRCFCSVGRTDGRFFKSAHSPFPALVKGWSRAEPAAKDVSASCQAIKTAKAQVKWVLKNLGLLSWYALPQAQKVPRQQLLKKTLLALKQRACGQELQVSVAVSPQAFWPACCQRRDKFVIQTTTATSRRYEAVDSKSQNKLNASSAGGARSSWWGWRDNSLQTQHERKAEASLYLQCFPMVASVNSQSSATCLAVGAM